MHLENWHFQRLQELVNCSSTKQTSFICPFFNWVNTSKQSSWWTALSAATRWNAGVNWMAVLWWRPAGCRRPPHSLCCYTNRMPLLAIYSAYNVLTTSASLMQRAKIEHVQHAKHDCRMQMMLLLLSLTLQKTTKPVSSAVSTLTSSWNAPVGVWLSSHTRLVRRCQ